MPSSSFQPKKIVIIEDNKDAAETLQLLLESVGHSAWGSSSGRDGLELIAKIKPDVVLCDIGLPEMDGFQVARALRENPDTKHLRLIALSGYGRQEDRLRSIESGFNAHLVKPADLDDLLSALSEPT